ncbi:acetyl-CoA synthetase-like protein [Sarocladium strictum]
MAVTSTQREGIKLQHPIHVLEQRARDGHDRPFANIPKSKDLSQGFMDVTYELLDNAVNRVAWWLEDVTGGAKPGTCFSWSGPNDLRYVLFLLAAMKCRYKYLKAGRILMVQYSGPPKPIPLPLECLTTVLSMDLIPGPRERRWVSLLEHSRLFCGFPPFHAAGAMLSGVYPILCDYTLIWGPSDRPLNAALAEEAINMSGADSSLLPPSILEDMAKTNSGLDVLGTLKSVTYGGGPLHPVAGDKVSKVTRLCNIYGSTETLLLPGQITSKEDWNYVELDPQMGYTFEHVQEDLYKLIVKRVPEFVPIQTVFLLMPDIDEFSIGDLLSPHPTNSNLWCIRGRADDLIILSSGEKFDPAPGEVVVKTSPLVSACLLVGRARPQALLLVERDVETTKDMSTEQVKEALWPVVEEMNNVMATQGQITPDHIIVAPLGAEFPRTPKGSIRRKQTEEMFEKDIDEVFGAKKPSTSDHAPNGNSNGNGRPDNNEPMDITRAVRQAVYYVCRIDNIGDDEDLFEYGLDSIQAQHISAALKKISVHWPEDSTKATAIIYSKPTIRGLVETVDPTHVHRNGNEVDDMETLIAKYTLDLPRSVATNGSAEGMAIAITGSTGNLGCNMLNDLIRHPNVAKIICLNRSADGKDAQDAAFARNKLTQAPLGATTVVHFKIDLSNPFLGLSPVQYATLQREVEVLIHNAWQLDFLRTVKAFEKTHIAGVRHLVDLAASSHQDMRIVFISSIGAVGGTNPTIVKYIPEEVVGPKISPVPNGYSRSKYVSEKILQEAFATSKVKSAIDDGFGKGHEVYP